MCGQRQLENQEAGWSPACNSHLTACCGRSSLCTQTRVQEDCPCLLSACSAAEVWNGGRWRLSGGVQCGPASGLSAVPRALPSYVFFMMSWSLWSTVIWLSVMYHTASWVQVYAFVLRHLHVWGLSLCSFTPYPMVSIQVNLVTLDGVYSLIKKNSLHSHSGWAGIGELGPGGPWPSSHRDPAGPWAAPRTACDVAFRPPLAQ